MPPEPQPKATDTTGQPSWMAPVKPVVPDHDLLRRIGGGSYGEVWLARTTVGTWRAVKVVFRDRFTDARPYEREFNGIQKFEPLSRGNEGFIDILQIGRNDAEGYFYYVMELADDAHAEVGGTSSTSPRLPSPELEPAPRVTRPSGVGSAFQPDTYVPLTLTVALLQRGRLPVTECLELGITLNLGLAHLHGAGLIHRDIKPSNIIFVGGVPKLADIGLVVETTEAQSYVGTEGFIPPEGPTSPQADLYSLGKVLYEAGMGKDRKDFPEPYTKIAEVPDSGQMLEFNAILLKACAANREDRYPSAEAMNADLALLQGGGSVRQQRKLAGQLRFVQRAGAVVTVIAALAAGLYLWQVRQTKVVRELAAEKSRLAVEKSQLADENRQRIVRLDIANGVRLLDEGDHSGALLWFADALTLVTNNPVEETVHRIRIQQVLRQMPRLLLSIASSNSIITGAWSPDGKSLSLATGARQGETYAGLVRLHDATDGHVVWTAEFPAAVVFQLRFSQDGKRLLVGSSPEQAMAAYSMPRATLAAVLDTDSGKVLYQYSASDSVTGALSPDGEYLAVARSNHVIQVIAAKDGTPVVELKGHSNQIAMLTFSVNSRLLASVSEDRSARLWRLPSGADAVPGLSHDRPLRRVALSDDGTRLATAASEDPGNADEGPWLVQVWDAEAGKLIGSTTESTLPYALFFSRGSDNRLFTGGNGPKIRVWDTRESSVSPIGEFNQDGGRCWDFSPDGTLLCLGDDGGHADLFRSEAGEHVLERCSHNGYVESVRFSPDGARLLTTSDDGTAKVWGIRRESESAALTLAADLGVAGFWDTILHGRRPGPIAIPLRGGVIQLIDPERLVDVASLRAQEAGNVLYSFTAGSTGRYWAVAEGKGKDPYVPDVVDLWEQKDDRSACLQLPHPMAVAFMTFTSGDSRLVSFARDWNVRVWRTSDGQLESVHPVPKNYLWGNATSSQGGSYWFRPDGGAMLLYLDAKDEPQPGEPPSWHEQLYDPFKGRWIGSPYNPYAWASGTIAKMAFSPDGTRLAMVAGQHGAVFDLREGGSAPVQFKHGGSLLDLDWSPDGNRLLTAGLAHDVRIWDVATGEQFLSPLPTGKSHNRMARWSADGRFVVSRSDDNVARVWNAATAEAVTPLLLHSGNIRWVCITPGNRLITASEPNLLRAWDLHATRLPAAVVADYARLLAGRKLDRAGVLQKLDAAELGELGTALRAAQPELFTTSTQELYEWHRRQVQQPTSLARVTAGLFHLERCAELASADSWVKEQQARFLACRIPARDPATPANLVDLSASYTHSFDLMPEGEFAELPRGEQELAGTLFDLRGLVRLETANYVDQARANGRSTLASFPLPEADDIAVGRRCRQLHFLQASDGDRVQAGDEVARWRIHFVNGSTREFPVIFGQHVEDWWGKSNRNQETDQAVVAWEGKRPAPNADQVIRLYKCTWKNPLPDTEISRLDFVIGKVSVRPFVVAVTSE